jgi:hypothetical protein
MMEIQKRMTKINFHLTLGKGGVVARIRLAVPEE